MRKIGVFVCHCGNNISSTVDVKSVAEQLSQEVGVALSVDYQYMCSAAGQNMVKDAIKEYSLDGIVVCACSPRMHEATFRKAASEAGLNPYMVEIANFREHVSWVHKDKLVGSAKAVILGRAAIAKLLLNEPLTAGETPVVKRALVIGGGIAGIQSALDIADAGFEVDIVERLPTIGGRMAQIDKTFPTLDCSACILTPKMVEVAAHEKINIYTYAEVAKISGFVGNFKVDIKKKAKYVNEDLCTGCAACIQKCPSKKARNEFNMSLDTRSAIYVPFAQAVPNKPTIDRQACIYFNTGKCGLCQKTCEVKAIDFEQQDKIISREYGAIMVATGFKPLKPNQFGEYLYGINHDVITSLELERIMNAAGPTAGKLVRPSDHETPKDIVFIQCVGSRGNSCREKPYCSKICCMYTAKHAMLIKDKYPQVKVHVFYIDVRTPGKNFDEFYRRAVEDYGVDYVKGMVGSLYTTANGKIMVQATDLLSNKQLLFKTDLVVLATAVEAEDQARELATMLTASMDTNDFFTEAHPKLRPVESPTAGIYLAGACQGPKDIPETVAQAGAAASKVIGLLCKDKLINNACVATVNELLCNGCSACKQVCPYGAIEYDEKQLNDHGVKREQRVAIVNSAICQGCGACAASCLSGAMDIKGFSKRQIMAEVDAICR